MAFDIYFIDDIPLDANIAKDATGKIIINDDLSETFFSALNVLSKRDYMKQWIDAIKQIENGFAKSALITTYLDRGGELIGMWWPLYLNKEQSIIYVQNQFIVRDVVGDYFDINKYNDSILDRRIKDEDGIMIAEWRIHLNDLIECKRKLSKYLCDN